MIIVPINFSDPRTMGITIYPFIFIRKDLKNDKITINHEKIHIKQQIELLVIGFYIWYIIEAIFKGYDNISFEREAYVHENDMEYIKHRKMFSFWKYLKKK